jgi:hypothetical protein
MIEGFEKREGKNIQSTDDPIEYTQTREGQEKMRKEGREKKKYAELGKADQKSLEKSLGEDLLREDFAQKAAEIPKMFKSVEVEVSGQNYVMKFNAFRKDGEKVEKVEELIADVKGEGKDKKKLSLDKIEGEFSLAAVEGGPKGVDLSCSIPVKRILTCQTPAILKRFITESFAGTTDYYRKLESRKGEKNKEAVIPVKPAESVAKNGGKEAKLAQIKKEAAAKGAEVAILSGDNFISVSVRKSDSTQLRLTSSDMAVWTVEKADKGKMSGRSSTENPAEFIRIQESEPNG